MNFLGQAAETAAKDFVDQMGNNNNNSAQGFDGAVENAIGDAARTELKSAVNQFASDEGFGGNDNNNNNNNNSNSNENNNQNGNGFGGNDNSYGNDDNQNQGGW